MTLQVRRLAIAGALLLALAITLVIRLDINSLNNQVLKEMQGFTQVGLEAKEHSFSFMHGIGLRLDGVTLKQEHYQVDAGHMNVGIRLLPLLLGKIEIDNLDIHDATIKVHPEAIAPTSSAISSLPVERIQLVRCKIQTFDGSDLLNNLHLDLRNIGANRETLWELQAQQKDHSLSGHGRLNFYNGEISAGFGKFKLDRVPLARLRAVTPASVFAWFENSEGGISGSLALDITHNQSWAVFGELRLQGEESAPPLRVRGKLEHPEAGLLTWHDSFIHFNDSAVMAIDGECNNQQCETGIDAMNVDLKTWFPLLPEGVSFHKQISGLTDLNAHIQWNDKDWDSSAAFRLKDASYHYQDNQYQLPEIELQSEELRGNKNSWFAKAILTSPDAKGEMAITSSQQRSGSKDMQINANQVDAPLWQPLANLLLTSLQILPRLEAEGEISGLIQLQQQTKGKTLSLDLDATKADLAYPLQFKKPENVPAKCKAEISWPNNNRTPDQVTLQSCHLDNSSLLKSVWKRSDKKQHITISDLSLQFDQLQHHAVLLPAGLSEFLGLVEGSGSSQKTADSTKDESWAEQMSGTWRLQNFGREQWHSNGTITAKNGLFESPRLLVEGIHGKAEFKGGINFQKATGDVDILAATLLSKGYPALPELLEGLNIRGRIHQAQLSLLNNQIQAIHGYYRLHRGKLNMENIQATIAGGELFSKKLSITPRAGSFGLAGKIRLKNIQLEQVNHLNALLLAEMKGKLHANVELQGVIPDASSKAWQLSNGDILIYSGQWNRQSEADTLSEHLGIKETELITHGFRELSFRFRIREQMSDISQLKLNLGGSLYSGKATISSDLEIEGALKSKEKGLRYAIDGNWPTPAWQPLQ